jgi:thiol-disulfide isomerase/thioredoxin
MRFFKQYILAALLVLLTAIPAYASDTLDIQSTLSRPGVRLVAVEFYATWCKPCMEAIPRWKALHDKYRDQGLRLMVVNTRDPDGACGVPGWTPDDVICDLDGYIADGLGVSDLPSAFLWSWQGNLLTQRGHVGEVEKAIETYFTKNPRIVVQATNAKGKESSYLRDLVRNEFSRQGKFTVVATEEERALAAKLRKESFGRNFNKAGRCKLGQEVSASHFEDDVTRAYLHLSTFIQVKKTHKVLVAHELI